MKKTKIFIEKERMSEVKMFLTSNKIGWSSNPFHIDGGTVALMIIFGAFCVFAVHVISKL